MPDVRPYIAALASMHDLPKKLLARAQTEAEDYESGPVSHEALLDHLISTGPSDPIRVALGPLLASWDAAKDGRWLAETTPGSPDRRAEVHRRLGLSPELIAWIDANYPPHEDDTVVITAQKVDRWYFAERKVGRFYWDAYRNHLESVKGWKERPLSDLDIATDEIVEQIADPSADKAYAARGLVVGYVQSGKTANFTGVVAKAIDAGYRHIIVMTGTIELLRGQTQRRIDMELLGVENLIGELSIDEATSDPKFDYANDDDWPDKFMRLGVAPDAAQRPNLIRYTRKGVDYKELIGSAGQLKPVKQHPNLPLFDTENLTRAPAGIFVIKKNKHVLEKLARDFKRVSSAFQEIPVLVIDDESDQASVNTVDPEKVEKARRQGKSIPERTAINKAISDLLAGIPRAQYLGYTATPFANVFIDPSDHRDLFPRDFVIGLRRPFGYMGASDFSDLGKDFSDVPVRDRPLSESNRRAHVRELVADEGTAGRREELRRAIDTFVLTGAVKLHRSDTDEKLRFDHHTMLVHESVRMDKHGQAADIIKKIWNTAGYSGPVGLQRLRELYDSDIVPVSQVRKEDGVSAPPPFDELVPYIGKAIGKISEFDNNPVIVVNGDTDVQRNQQQLDFDRGEVWRILVGGTKLSRGFTVEGLTVSYYRRVAGANDTLTQAGRWFGFRPGFADLIRIFIGTREKRGRREINLLEAFDAVVQDEEAFRDQLKMYSKRVDGQPQVRPRDIPPLVSQHLFWLKPTANNKMFNAVLEEQGDREFGPTGYPLQRQALSENLRAWTDVLGDLTEPRALRATTGTFNARLQTLDTKRLIDVLRGHHWLPNFGARRVAPWVTFLENVAPRIDRFVVILVQPDPPSERALIPGLNKVSLVSRSRRSERGDALGEPTEPRHRVAAERLVGSNGSVDEALEDFRAPRQGALLCYLVRDSDHPDGDPILAFRAYLPSEVVSASDPIVRFRAVTHETDEAVVDVK